MKVALSAADHGKRRSAMRRVVITGLGHRLAHRQQCRRGRSQPARRQIRHRFAPEYAERGFRSQVHGMPQIVLKTTSTSATCASWAMARPTTSSPWNRRSPIPA
jgi:hypothetical protein